MPCVRMSPSFAVSLITYVIVMRPALSQCPNNNNNTGTPATPPAAAQAAPRAKGAATPLQPRARHAPFNSVHKSTLSQGLSNWQRRNLAKSNAVGVSASLSHWASLQQCCAARNFRCDELHAKGGYLIQSPEILLTAAHFDPDDETCPWAVNAVVEELSFLSGVKHGTDILHEALGTVYGDHGWNLPRLHLLVQQYVYPFTRDSYFNMLVAELQDRGFPALGTLHGSSYDFGKSFLVVLRHCMAYATLLDFHERWTRTPSMMACRNISRWFNGQLQLTPLGEACQDKLVDAPLLHDGMPLTLHAPGLLLVDEYLAGVEDGTDLDPEYSRKFSDVCDNFAHCAYVFTAFSLLCARYVCAPAALCYLCWRPDLLVFWKAAPLIHTPSFRAYMRQIKQQQLTAKMALQASRQAAFKRIAEASTGPSSTNRSRTSSRSSRASISSCGSSRSSSPVGFSGSWSWRAGHAGATHSTSSSACLLATRAKQQTKAGFFWCYLSGVVCQSWRSRVCFAVVSYWQAMLSCLRLPWRLLAALCCAAVPSFRGT